MSRPPKDSFDVRRSLAVGKRKYELFSLRRLEEAGLPVGRLPFSLRILVENLLRHEDGVAVRREEIEALARWDPCEAQRMEIAFTPARVLLQDFTGVPAVVDLAAMRDAMAEMGGDPAKINPIFPAELVVDHSVQVDSFGRPDSFARNVDREFERNQERYELLRWAQGAFRNFAVVPPATGIVHQVNLEHLARVVCDADGVAFPDTLVGTDSHTTMVNGLGVLGWGVGGIEAEAAMLGQPLSMLIPEVIGFRLHGRLPEGTTATDLVLTVTEILRKKKVVGKFVEFFGEGVESLSLPDRATLANMSPEYGSTAAIFPIDRVTIDYLRLTGRSEERVRLAEAYAREQGLFRETGASDPLFGDVVDLDLGTVEATLAGPRRPHDRVPLRRAKESWAESLPSLVAPSKDEKPSEESLRKRAEVSLDGESFEIGHGSVVIASITSCTNTSNPSVLVAAGLLAKKAAALGLRAKPWVKTSLAPGSKVVTRYLADSGLSKALEELRFHLVGYGCMTCIGNSGPLPDPIREAIRGDQLVVASVLSGNRNFEGRINPDTRANYLASPPLVVAYALAGRIDIDFYNEPIGKGRDGKEVFLRDIWPRPEDIHAVVEKSVRAEMFAVEYADVFAGDERWRAIPVPEGDRFAWDSSSTYVRKPPFFEKMSPKPEPLADIEGARVLAVLGDTVTTDHISPAGSIPRDMPAGKYLVGRGVDPVDFNSYGARRGNHEVMMRGTFGNVRLRNSLAPGTEGGWTTFPPGGETVTIFEGAERYRNEGTPLLVLAGKEYGSGSSRDWAAKGTAMLGIRAVLAESFERIHRSNLIGMGVLPLQFLEGEGRESLGLDGRETFDVRGIGSLRPGGRLRVAVRNGSGGERSLEVLARIDTPMELEYYRHGGILRYVLRQLLSA
ncbi:MAG: aconitate hydratase AcnA [Candidatus Eisenbacteria bacterium]